METPREDLPDSLRLFVSIPFPSAVRERLHRASAPLRRVDGVRGVRAEQLHLTLRFLGDVARERLSAIAAGLERAAAGVPPFPLLLAGAGAFPAPERPRVLWIGAEPAPALGRLHAAVEDALGAAGFPPEDRPFHPHVTVGRFRGGRPPPALARALAEIEVEARHEVSEIALVWSRLAASGARHESIASPRLGGGAEEG